MNCFVMKINLSLIKYADDMALVSCQKEINCSSYFEYIDIDIVPRCLWIPNPGLDGMVLKFHITIIVTKVNHDYQYYQGRWKH